MIKETDAPGVTLIVNRWFKRYFLSTVSLTVLGGFYGSPLLNGADAIEASKSVNDSAEIYASKIKPMLRERCFGCHGGLKQEGNLRLDTVESMLQGGDSGAAIDIEQPSTASLLIERLASDDESYRMPPPHEGEAFTQEQLKLLQDWIEAGAPGIENEQPEKSPEEHWSFRPLVKPELPTSLTQEQKAWAKNGIDQFIALGHQRANVYPAVEASRAILLRRLTLDLIGVLPTLEEIQAFEQDDAPDWYEKAVDRLLDDPRHGERWARHWMDNWRYSDWWGLGNELRNSQRTIWHWRDWIIESLNEDKPYDQFVRSMLAADELTPEDDSEIRATGFLARNYYIFNRHKWLDETVEHVGKAFLGLTMNCAKCHDHKFDPVTQVDYYKMRAFFEPYHVRTDMVPGKLDIANHGIPRAFDAELTTPTYVFIRGEETKPDTSKAIPPGLPELLVKEPLTIEEIDLPPGAYELQRRPWVAAAYREQAVAGIRNLERELKEAQVATREAKAVLEQTKSQPDSETVRSPIASFADSFTSLDETRWQKHEGDWNVTERGLEQNQDGTTRPHLNYRETVPQDFEATLTYQLRGGSMWRSVGLTFDATDDSEITVYASGAANQSKVQASYKQNGQSHFPGDGAKAMSIPLDTDVTLRVLVRDRLVNVFFNGERVVAWHSPIERTSGAFQIFNFDAISTLKRFEIAPLAIDTELYDPQTKESTSGDRIAQAKRAYLKAIKAENVVSQKLELQNAILDSIDARIAAFQAIWADGASTDVSEEAKRAHKQAVRAERYVTLLNSKLGVYLATPLTDIVTAIETDSQSTEEGSASEKTMVALSIEEQKKWDEAKDQLAKAQAAYDAEVQPTDPVTPFVATKWSVTRFQFTGKDDPAIAIPSKSTGRRKALAEWIASPSNPLTARVAVNHLWTRHMDQPLAANTFDFGRNSPDPLHPELIDWLAAEFVENGWSMKHIHRLIVNSATYRMDSSGRVNSFGSREAQGETAIVSSDRESTANSETGASEPTERVSVDERPKLDPDNRYWWKRNPMRLESQVIRDSILQLAGKLDPTVGGPPVPPEQQDKSLRRSLYFFHSNNDRNQFLTTFDEATVSECYRREQSIVPQQALALSNSGLVLDNIGEIAKRISEQSSGGEQDFVRNAFRSILGLEATDQEITLASSALQSWNEQPDINEEQARSLLVLSLLNHNDFVTLR